MIGHLPPLVERYLDDVLVVAAAPLALSFDREWKLVGAVGDASHYGLDTARPERGLSVLRDLFLGLEPSEPQAFPYVELPGGKSAHVHLLPDGDRFHVVLLDASADTARQRSLQQLGNEAAIASHERGRALRKLKKVHTELEAQAARLVEADALKDALMATLSHEFRTPLTSTFGYLHLMERSLKDDPRYSNALRAIRRASTHLLALAENLLEYARADAGGSLVQVGRVDLARMAEDLAAMFEPIAREQQLRFSMKTALATDERPQTDELKLRQILINLISNAIRYTPSGEVSVTLEFDGKRIRAIVRDTGVGIAPEHQRAIFEPFNRTVPRGSKGAGLGLSIARSLAEQLGGAITLESALGSGSTFRVDLPAPPPAGVTIQLPAADAAIAPRRGGHALLADDDPDVRELLRVLMKEAGFSVYAVGNAPDAFEYATKHAPDLCVVDVQMPGLSGNAAVYKLRSSGYRGRVITLSATPTADARAAALAAGADAFLTKPVDVEQFVRLLAV